MLSKLEKMLSPKRFAHSLGVRDTAVWLAKKHKYDRDKASVAGLLHDCAKDLPLERLFSICEKIKHDIDDITRIETGLIHAYAGAYIAKTEFNIHDPEVLAAIYYHTTGAEDMSMLMKIVYVADMCEPGRKMEEAAIIKKIAATDLDRAALFSFDVSIKHVLKKGRLIHPNTILSRNFIINQIEGREFM